MKRPRHAYSANIDEYGNINVNVLNYRESAVPTGNHIGTGLVAIFGITLIGLMFVLRKKASKS